jgi:cytochrome c oxidase accessory protein FixG
MMTMTRRVQPYRRVVEVTAALLFLLVPFFSVGGDGVLRFDVTRMQLHLAGKVIPVEHLFIFLTAIFCITFFFMLLTQWFGRVWCGWMCPQTVVCDFTRYIDRLKKKGSGKKLLLYLTLLPISVLLAAVTVWYFVSPYEFFERLGQGALTDWESGSWIVLTVIIFFNFALIRRRLCATVCPYGMMQNLLFDDFTLIIGLDPQREKECIDCLRCVQVCPVGIDIRTGLSSTCIACAECVDACASVMKKLKKKSLINYMFGYGKQRKWLRPATWISGTAALFFTGLFLVSLYAMNPFDLEVYPDAGFRPRMNAANNRMINAYDIKIKNHRTGPVDVELSIVGLSGKQYTIEPHRRFHVQGRDTYKGRVFLLLDPELLAKRSILLMTVKVTAAAEDGAEIYSSNEIGFRRPLDRKKQKRKRMPAQGRHSQ